ncbi:MAG: hypothetical protein ACREA4_03625 [Nitrososphaera sp.]
MQNTDTMGVPISAFTHYQVVSVNPISDSIKNLKVITCDICKTAGASHDVFVQGLKDVAFLRRCCDQCVKSIN